MPLSLIAKSASEVALAWWLMVVSLSAAETRVMLDADMFPEFSSEGKRSAVVPANWALPGADKAWIPMRLFGTATGIENRVTLQFTVQTPGVTVAFAKKSGEEGKVKKQGEVFELEVSLDETTKGWWCELFLLVGLPAASPPPVPPAALPAAPPAEFPERPVTLLLKAKNGLSGAEIQLLLGECWLVAGGPNVAVQTVPSPNEGLVVAKSWGEHCSTVAAMPKDTVTAAGEKRAPALAAFFARELTSLYPRKTHGCRPVCVYTWMKARTLMERWLDLKDRQTVNTPASAWDGLFSYDADGKLQHGFVLPGIHGVIWWHGEWEAERSGTLMTGTYGLNVADFEDAYADAGVKLRRMVSKRLARSDEASTPDEQISAHIRWVVLQSPGAGRKPEFFDVLHQGRTKPGDSLAEGRQPQSSWAALRAAQFETVRRLRGADATKRPVDLLVPLGGTAPGWVWGVPSEVAGSAERFREAAGRIAHEIHAADTLAPIGTTFADGWPILEKRDGNAAKPSVLRFAGVTNLAPPPTGAALPGVRAPTLEARVGTQWQLVEKAPVGIDGGVGWELPVGTEEVRYGWGDANAGAHERRFSGRKVGSPLPAFRLLNN